MSKIISSCSTYVTKVPSLFIHDIDIFSFVHIECDLLYPIIGTKETLCQLSSRRTFRVNYLVVVWRRDRLASIRVRADSGTSISVA